MHPGAGARYRASTNVVAMDVRRRLVEQTVLLTFAQLLALAVGFVATVLITRALGPEGRGLFAWMMTLVGMAVQVATLASNQSVRAIASEIGGEARFVPTLLSLSLAGTILGLPILAYAFAQLPARLDPLLVTAWIMVPLMAAAVSLLALVQIRERPGAILCAHLGPKAALLLAAAALWSWGRLDLAAAIWLNIGVAVFQFALLLALAPWNGSRLRPSLALARRVATRLGAGWLAGLAFYALPRAGLVMLGNRNMLAEAGYYSVAVTLFEIMSILPAAASGVLTTHLASHASARPGPRTALALVAFMTLCSVAAALAAPVLIPLAFGEAFRPAVAPFQGLLAAVILGTVYQFCQGALHAGGRPWPILLPPVLGLAVAIPAGWLAVPPLGAFGAVAATLVGFSVLAATALALVVAQGKRA